ncbi:MAG: hypothetical protein CL760_12900 [Chloroflexi bacterium]|nr:hypothetical protein [Chloroflexota bacterium]|tara:strand:+ start:55281 stop:55700 length:420 start_codon:yes stop_codon:yes gene_type:complete
MKKDSINPHSLRTLLEEILIYFRRKEVGKVFPTRAFRDLNSECAHEELLNKLFEYANYLKLPIKNTEVSKFSIENLFAFASYLNENLDSGLNVSEMLKYISDGVLLNFDDENWVSYQNIEKLDLDLENDLLKLMLNSKS